MEHRLISLKRKKRSSKYIAPGLIGRSMVKKPQPFSSFTSPVNPTSRVQPTSLQKSISNMLEAEYVVPRARDSPPPRCFENLTNEVPPLQDHHQNVRYEVPLVAESGELDNDVSVLETTVTKKVRGPNICKTVAELQPGEKLPVTFYWNHAAGLNHTAFSRYLGKIVRNNQVCPVRIKEWSDLTDAQKDHMWAATKDKFDNPEMEFYRKHVFRHMKALWSKWRSNLHIEYIRNDNRSLEEALKVVPPIMNKEEWEWCVNEVFFSDEYQKRSTASASKRKLKDIMPIVERNLFDKYHTNWIKRAMVRPTKQMCFLGLMRLKVKL
ncbi:hypothetical protein LINPERPRIM_LOCUS29628 [Linum perenne]